jgi:DNA mismatch repair protein MutH
MATKRKTGIDYRKELNELRKSEISINAHIKNRIITLSEKYPDAVIILSPSGNIKANALTKDWLNKMPIDMRLIVLERIEKYSARIEKVEQLTIDKIYNEIPDESKKC